MHRFLSLLFALSALASCGRRAAQEPSARERQTPKSAHAVAEKQYVFRPPVVPGTMTPDKARDYLREHYWDHFDFADTMFVHKADSAMMFQAFVQFVDIISDRPNDPAPMRTLMQRASVSRPMMDYFASMAQTVFEDPNSPRRNDEFYIPVLEAQLAAPFYDEYERIGPQYTLDLARQNRIGLRANDFRYTVASGKSATLYGLQAEFVLLFINNPGCPMCREIREAVCASPMLSDLIAQGRLKVLALYPDEDLAAWRDYRSNMPAAWINAYDKGCVIRETSSYNLSAIPALYLLDRDKRVLVKDATEVWRIEAAIMERLQAAAS